MMRARARYAIYRRPGVSVGRRHFRQPTPGELNSSERQYADYLEGRPDVVAWQYDRVSFRLGERCFFRPDFRVVIRRPDMTTWVEYHEVKTAWRTKHPSTGGSVEKPHIEDEALVKLKAAAELYPEEQFVVVWWSKAAQRWQEDRL